MADCRLAIEAVKLVRLSVYGTVISSTPAPPLSGSAAVEYTKPMVILDAMSLPVLTTVPGRTAVVPVMVASDANSVVTPPKTTGDVVLKVRISP